MGLRCWVAFSSPMVAASSYGREPSRVGPVSVEGKWRGSEEHGKSSIDCASGMSGGTGQGSQMEAEVRSQPQEQEGVMSLQGVSRETLETRTQ